MVKASDKFGPLPVCNAWLITASVSAFHHSPAVSSKKNIVGSRKNHTLPGLIEKLVRFLEYRKGWELL